MRNKSIILAEIVELSEIKSAYNYYLASSRSLTEVENTTQVRHNRNTISGTINSLYGELRQLPTEPQAFTGPNRISHSLAEQQAILSFNRDRRFNITE